ncbi:MAG: HEPN domain-containing protein [Deltaproteobacteria bacterium]|nr:HEPN domain-containing protein [Deltaproteobacteria bacterium]
MSTEKSVQEALRWIRTAEDDLQAAIILKGSRKYSHACFHAQQAGEKSVKSVWYFADEDPKSQYMLDNPRKAATR